MKSTNGTKSYVGKTKIHQGEKLTCPFLKCGWYKGDYREDLRLHYIIPLPSICHVLSEDHPISALVRTQSQTVTTLTLCKPSRTPQN